MLPLTATTLVRHNAVRADAVRRGLQELMEFTVGVLGFDTDQAGKDAIARHRIWYKHHPLSKPSDSIPAVTQIRNDDFYQFSLSPQILHRISRRCISRHMRRSHD
jgi:hypothetical protein